MRKLFLALGLILCLAGSAFAWPTWTGTATLTYATDNNTTSAVSVPRDCKTNIGLVIPTIETSTLAVHVSADGTTYQAYSYNAGAAAAPAAWVVGSGTGAISTELPQGVLAFKYLRFEFGTGQTANRTLTVQCN